MFGFKRQKEILAILKNIEKQTRDTYHFLSADMATLETEIESINLFLHNLDINHIVETMQYFNTTTNYIADIIDNIDIREQHNLDLDNEKNNGHS